MNELMFVRTFIDEFTEELIKFCKPLMMDVKYKKEIAALLNAESNLRMTIEMATETVDTEELYRKLLLSKEETESILNILTTINLSQELVTKAKELLLLENNLIQEIK